VASNISTRAFRRRDTGEHGSEEPTRQGNSLTQTLRWQRFYRKYPHSRKSMEQIERELTARVSVLTEMAARPARYTSGPAWTKCMERLEDVTAELSVVRACLKDGG
jgi:hypothetical protein